MKTVLIILSAGRCGSTNIINRLNQEKNINIYGESFGALPDLVRSAYRFNLYNKRFIETNAKRKLKSQIAAFSPIEIASQLNKTSPYIGNEYYNDHEVIKNILDTLNNSIVNFFKREESVVGFKEIVWGQYSNLNFLNYLETLHLGKVKYLKLTRDIDEQSHSMSKNFKENGGISFQKSFETITKCNENIDSFLQSKNSKKKYECNYVSNSELYYKNILEWIKN